jgi:hypothetical protein
MSQHAIKAPKKTYWAVVIYDGDRRLVVEKPDPRRLYKRNHHL